MSIAERQLSTLTGPSAIDPLRTFYPKGIMSCAQSGAPISAARGTGTRVSRPPCVSALPPAALLRQLRDRPGAVGPPPGREVCMRAVQAEFRSDRLSLVPAALVLAAAVLTGPAQAQTEPQTESAAPAAVAVPRAVLE